MFEEDMKRINACIEHKDYYTNNELLKSIYIYFEKIIKSNYALED